jgi:hypothetical protein
MVLLTTTKWDGNDYADCLHIPTPILPNHENQRTGTVTPSSGWYNSGAKVTIKATAKSSRKFKSWKGTGSGSFTGTTNPASVTMNAAITETATFT